MTERIEPRDRAALDQNWAKARDTLKEFLAHAKTDMASMREAFGTADETMMFDYIVYQLAEAFGRVPNHERWVQMVVSLAAAATTRLITETENMDGTTGIEGIAG